MMEVVKWAGGLWEHEVRAIEKIEQAFGQESVQPEHQKVSQIKSNQIKSKGRDWRL